MAKTSISVMQIYSFVLICGCVLDSVLSQSGEEWNKRGRDDLERALDLEMLNTNVAKNVIVFLGDGMGIPTITAARIRKGQLQGNTGEETVLTFEGLPRSSLIKTYNTDYQVADSAGTATAILTGVKTKRGMLGIDDSAERGDCESSKGAEVDSVFTIATRTGKSAGIISTVSITNASPSAVYSHTPERDWQAIGNGDCEDIASQLIASSEDYQVVLTGGRSPFTDNTTPDPENPQSVGERIDGRNLIEEWKDKVPNDMVGSYVWNKTEFDSVDPMTTDYLLGLFAPSSMQYDSDRDNDIAGEPSIAEMVDKAINILRKNDNGFFLFVEGGRIDHAHHDDNAYDALGDTIALDDAVAKALDLVDTKDTLIIVTADHSHVNTISGYPLRGNPILGVTGEIADDGLPYTTIGYANGPSGEWVLQSIRDNGNRPNLTEVDTEAKGFQQQALVHVDSERHGGEDISLHADGPYSHLFQGVYEQSYIAHVIKYAACLAEYKDRHGCDQTISAASRRSPFSSPGGFIGVIILTSLLMT
ncbi:alkaline phosphatase-like [Glandiceps talaboti]